MIKTQMQVDVVVIGSGGGGLRAGIEAASKGANTLIISKGKINRSGATLLAGANISADIACDGGSLYRLGISDCNKFDTKELWLKDLLHEGFYLNNQELVAIFAETAEYRVEELVKWGMNVRGMEGKREISVFGSDILDTLYARAKQLKVKFMEDTVFTDIVAEDNVIKGVVCLDLYSGELFYINAKAVVIATGGAHNLFSVNSGSTDLCGDGQAAALRADVALVDMEMISYCPTVTLNPIMYRGNILPYIFFTQGFGNIKNKFGKAFTHKHLSKEVEQLALESEWNKMLLSYAIYKEISEGKGSKNGGVYFDLNLHPTEFADELYAQLPPLKKGIYADIMKVFESGRCLTIVPAAHYFEGGIKINTKMETSLKGLYAAGECAGGMFGANRVSAATTEMLVEGAIAGGSAADYARNTDIPLTPSVMLSHIEEELLTPFKSKGGLKPHEVINQIQQITDTCLTVIRNGEKLEKMFEELTKLESAVISVDSADRVYNRPWFEFIQVRNMLLCAKAIIKSASLRKESRGVHIRDDYFFTDNNEFLKNIVIDNHNLDYHFEDVKFTKMEIERTKMPYTEYVEHLVGKLE